MATTNPLHRATRAVRRPEAWANAPRDVQVDYYNFLGRRLIPSTDIYVGDRLLYRTNAIGCRGDDLVPGRPVLAVFGDGFVHGPIEGGFVEELAIAPYHILNAGIEDLTLTGAADRFLEVHAAAPLTCALFAPPRHGLSDAGLPGQAEHSTREAAWEADMSRLPLGEVKIAVLRTPKVTTFGAEQGLSDRYDRFIEAFCQRHGLTMIDADDAAPKTGLKAMGLRMLGLGAKAPAGKSALAALVEARMAGPAAEALTTQPQTAAPPPQTAASGAHGPDSVGRTYPLW